MEKACPHPFVAAVRSTVRARGLFSGADRVLVALSAGPDSTALLGALAALRDEGGVASLTALHVDHGLRQGTEVEAACAAEACARLGVSLRVVRVQVKPGNVQAEARRARYSALRAEAARTGATRIATGHTRTDQAETVLLRLLRGSGARGLSGIPPRRGALVRPLIDRSRAEVLAYLEAVGLRACEDPSNASPRYARNRVRHTLVPVLSSLSPHAERALARAADLLRDDERALSARARALLSDPAAPLSLARLRAAPVAVQRRVVREAYRAAGGRAPLAAARVEEVLALSARTGPGRLALPGGLEARCRYGGFAVGPRVPAPVREVSAAVVGVPGPGRYPLPGGGAVVVRAAAGAQVPWPLELRARRAGDRFRPDGGPGTKKLKAWLIDRKVPRERRASLWLLASGNRVLVIPELRMFAAGAGPGGLGLEVQMEPGEANTVARR